MKITEIIVPKITFSNLKSIPKITYDTVVGQNVIQRDSGDLYHVTQLRLGSNSQKLVNLQKSNANTKMTLDADKFINALNTPGSPWKLK